MTTTPKIYLQIHTRYDWETLSSDIDRILVSIFIQNESTFNDALDGIIGQNSAKTILDSLLEKNIPKDNSLEVKNHLETMKEDLRKMKDLRMTLAIDLPSKIIRDISLWAKQSIDPSIYLDIRVDSTIVGGAILIYEGKYYDESISHLINQKIPEVIKKLQNPQ